MKNRILFTVGSLAVIALSSCALFQGRQGKFDENDYYRRVASAVVRQDLIMGMRPLDVRTAWGTPYQVEAAQHQDNGNERWVYMNGLSAPGFRDMAEKRVVYFENGEVVGWETLR